MRVRPDVKEYIKRRDAAVLDICREYMTMWGDKDARSR